ncbi:MAG: hypothetical protein ACI9KE_002726, partial [Polyangiales bacterium]
FVGATREGQATLDGTCEPSVGRDRGAEDGGAVCDERRVGGCGRAALNHPDLDGLERREITNGDGGEGLIRKRSAVEGVRRRATVETGSRVRSRTGVRPGSRVRAWTCIKPWATIESAAGVDELNAIIEAV